MEIVPIFEPYLYAFQYENEDENEYDRLMNYWSDAIELEQFFTDNIHLLNQKYKNLTIDTASEQTADIVDNIRNEIEDKQENLDTLFQNLNDMVSSRRNMSDQKHKNKWVRLFAIMIEPNYYIVTGGAIKLSEKLENHPTTLNELQKLKMCQTYFFNKNVKDIDTFFEIIL